jgi:hypothetical protein
MASIVVALTFDDGPDGIPGQVGTDKPYNTTERILTVLDSPGTAWPEPIKAAFFVQTHAPGRMLTAGGIGEQLVRRAYQADHVIGIGSGSSRDRDDHVTQNMPPIPEVPRLIPNLQRAANALNNLLGQYPSFVRGHAALRNAAVDAAYSNPGVGPALQYVFWDIQGFDLGRKPGRQTVAQRLKAQMRSLAHRARTEKKDMKVVVLLHDSSFYTAFELESYIQALVDGAAPTRKELPIPFHFCRSRAEVETVLREADSSQPPSAIHPKDRRRNLPLEDFEFIHPHDYDNEEATIEAWHLFSFEKLVQHLYLDSAEDPKVTVGIGHVAPRAEMAKVDANGKDFIEMWKGNALATILEKEQQWDAINDIARSDLSSEAYADRPPHRLTMRPDFARHLFAGDRDKLGQQRARNVLGSAYDDAPLPARVAIIDLVYNSGYSYIKQSTLCGQAIRDAKWLQAAANSHRDSVNTERNEYVFHLFEIADLAQNKPKILVTIAPPSAVIATTPSLPSIHIEVRLAPGWSIDGVFDCSATIVYRGHGRNDQSPTVVATQHAGVFDIPFHPSPVQGGIVQVVISSLKLRRGTESVVQAVVQNGLVKGSNPLKASIKAQLAAIQQPPIGDAGGTPSPVTVGHVYQAIAYHASTKAPGSSSSAAFHCFDADGLPLSPTPDTFGLMRLPLVDLENGELLWHWQQQIEAARELLAEIDDFVSAAWKAVQKKFSKAKPFTSEERRMECLQRYGSGKMDAPRPLFWKWNQVAFRWERKAPGPTYADEIKAIYDGVVHGAPPPDW